MRELEIVREKIQSKYRVVKTDEDLEWNRAIDLCTNIINAHLSCENAAETARSFRDNDGWIPVSERLPEEKKSVLVQWEKYDRHLNVTLIYLDVMWLDDIEGQVFETINGVPNGRVIAWRPLPEPYCPERRE